MQEYLSFFQHHWILSLAFAIILLLLILNEMRYRMSGVAFLVPQQVTQAINREAAVLVDIRGRNDFNKGHIVGALNILESEIAAESKRLEKHQSKQIIVIDATGQKAHSICLQLKKQGFDQVALLKGGIQAWLAEGLPVVK